ncbi:MAG: putative membrane protein YiaA [Cellvibrionaceae bacterium]|jgi:uncharacterized membrane protein YiaA
MWDDIVIGLITGTIQIFFFRPFYTAMVSYSFLLILKAIKEGNLAIFLANVIVLIPISFYLISVLLLKPFVSVWNDFLIGWLLGFCVAAFGLIFFSKKKDKKNKKIRS